MPKCYVPGDLCHCVPPLFIWGNISGINIIKKNEKAELFSDNDILTRCSGNAYSENQRSRNAGFHNLVFFSIIKVYEIVAVFITIDNKLNPINLNKRFRNAF